MHKYRSYTVRVRATTERQVEEHQVTVYASSAAEASEFAADEVAGKYRGREVEIDVVEILPQRNRL